MELHLEALQFLTGLEGTFQEFCIDIPMPDGSDECFYLEPTNILPTNLKGKRPDIKTFKGISANNSKRLIYFSQSNHNFHLIGDSDTGTFFIDKIEKEAETLYMSYYAKDEVIPFKGNHYFKHSKYGSSINRSLYFDRIFYGWKCKY